MALTALSSYGELRLVLGNYDQLVVSHKNFEMRADTKCTYISDGETSGISFDNQAVQFIWTFGILRYGESFVYGLDSTTEFPEPIIRLFNNAIDGVTAFGQTFKASDSLPPQLLYGLPPLGSPECPALILCRIFLFENIRDAEKKAKRLGRLVIGMIFIALALLLSLILG